MRFQGWMHKILMRKNITYIATCDIYPYYAVRRFYFFHITSSYKDYFLHINRLYIFREQFLLLAPMTTYFKDLTQSIGMYGGLSWQNWVKSIWMHK